MRSGVSPGAYVVPLFMVLFGLVYAYANRNVPPADMHMATPITIGLIVVALVIAFRNAIQGPGEREPYSLKALQRPVLLILATAILLAGGPYDFPIASAVFLAVSIFALGYRRLAIVLPVAILTSVAIFLAFVWVGVPLSSFWLEV